ncbi:MAG: hypothetical protein ACLQVL_34345 [Terriglobia bacterium]
MDRSNVSFPNVFHAPAEVEEGRGLKNSRDHRWPLLSSRLDEVERDLLKRMWKFGQEHEDIMFNLNLTVATVPYGPAIEI